jgi:hypothetical protein
MMIHQKRHAGKGKALQIHTSELMAPWVYDEKFPMGTQFLFGTLLFATREDGNLELQVGGQAPSQWALIYGEAPYYPANLLTTTTSTSDGPYLGMNPCVGPYLGNLNPDFNAVQL